jgi:hypothetical protein
MARLEYLPDEVLKLVMQHVPVKARLTSCCLVNSRLLAAAVATAQELQLYFGSLGSPLGRIPHQQAGCVVNWLSLYGKHLTCLNIAFFAPPLQQLPCPNLLELSLEECSVQLGPAADGRSGVLQGCTKLTCLELYCKFIDIPGGVLGSLSSLEHLQHLEVWPEGDCSTSTASLTGLQHLTCLETCCSWLSHKNILELSTLTSLQEATLDFASELEPVGPKMFPDLAFPASLTKLLLSSWVEAGILSAAPAGLRHLEVSCGVESPAEGPGSLLSCLARLQHLTYLGLEPASALEWPPAGPAYSALTASSSLGSLVLKSTSIPGYAWPHVFPATRQLLCLTSLCASEDDDWGALSVLSG